MVRTPANGGATPALAALSPEQSEPRASARRRSVNARDAEWQRFAGKLAEALGCLDDGQYLILETRDEHPYYVQFAARGDGGFRAEAVSNRFLESWRRLDATAEARLRRLGWRPPVEVGEGPVNWWRNFVAPGSPAPPAALAPSRAHAAPLAPTPVPRAASPAPPAERAHLAAMAELAVATLRKAYEVPRAAGLAYKAFSRSGGEILLPSLGLRRAAGAPLPERVDAFLRDYLDVEEVMHDADGDCAIRNGDAAVFVRVAPDRRFVSVFSPALLGVPRSTALLDAVNELNGSILVGRAFVRGDQVMVVADVEDNPGVRHGLIKALEAVSSLTNEIAFKLQPRFGGRTYFGLPVEVGGPPDGPGYGLYL